MCNPVITPVFGIVGVCVGALLSYLFAHKTWVSDNKKMEWRELIDVVGDAIRDMDALDQGADAPNAGVPVFIVLNNRIFIAKTVARENLKEQWDQVNRDFNKERLLRIKERSPQMGDDAILASRRARQAFPNLLIDLSRRDLRIP